MVQNINDIVNFVADNFLLIFALYSITFFVVRAFKKDKTGLEEFDQTAVKSIIWVGTLWILLKITGIIIFLFQMKIEDKTGEFSQHFSWFMNKSWLQLVFWLILPQLLRIKIVSRYLVPRVLLGFLFAFSFERITILSMNLHHDYLPDGFNINIPELILGLLLKTLIFTLIVSVFQFGKRFIYKK